MTSYGHGRGFGADSELLECDDFSSEDLDTDETRDLTTIVKVNPDQESNGIEEVGTHILPVTYTSFMNANK